jgi:hypothetical protein
MLTPKADSAKSLNLFARINDLKFDPNICNATEGLKITVLGLIHGKK